MKDKIVNLMAKFAGVGKILQKLSGGKTYVAGSASILSGLAGLLAEIAALLEKQDASAWIEFGKRLPADPNWIAILAGLAAVGLRHAIQKQEPPKPA